MFVHKRAMIAALTGSWRGAGVMRSLPMSGEFKEVVVENTAHGVGAVVVVIGVATVHTIRSAGPASRAQVHSEDVDAGVHDEKGAA